MRTRRVSAFSISAIFHVVALVAAIWLEGQSLALTPPPQEAEEQEPVVVLVDSLPPSSTLDSDLRAQSLGIAIDDDSSSVEMPQPRPFET